MKKIIPPILLSVCLAWLPFKADSAIDITDFGDLRYPFSALDSTKYSSTTDWLHGDTFFGARKQAVVTRVMDQVFAYFKVVADTVSPPEGTEGRNVLEIGTGRGHLTSRIARHIYQRRVVESSEDYLLDDVFDLYLETPAPHLGTVVITIDNWQPRDEETIETHGITVPLRQAIGAPTSGGLVAETDIPQMLSNLLHEATRVGGESNANRNNFLDMILIPIRDSDEASVGPITTGQFITPANDDAFFDAIARPNDLHTVSSDYNSSFPFAMIVVDTDTRNSINFANMLLRAYNQLPVGGVLVVDDINWGHQSDGPGARQMGEGFELFLQAVSPYLFDVEGTPSENTSSTTLTDTVNPAYHVVNYDAEGNPLNLTSYSEDVLLSAQVYNSQNLPVLEYHAVWETNVPWMAVFRKVGVGIPLETTPVEYAGGTLS